LHSRIFRYGCLFVNGASGIQRPEDLRGKRMGVPEYSMTAAVWLRGLFEHEYGIAPKDIHWIQAGEENPGRKDRVDFEMPAGVRLQTKPDPPLNHIIQNRDIAPIMPPRQPTSVFPGPPALKPPF